MALSAIVGDKQMMKSIVAFLALSILSCTVYSKSVCNSQLTKKIESCAESNYKGADSVLNHVYQTLALKWNGADMKWFATNSAVLD
jgi:uncharacterized protein YecT (DUF1311 family)